MNFGIRPQTKDFEINQPPTDGVTDLQFSPQADFLAASSWDNQVINVNQTRIYEIQQNGTSQGKAVIQHEAPSLGVCWSTDGSKVISVGCDKQAKMLDLQTNQTIQVGAHDAPIKAVRYIDGLPTLNNMIVTGSWDKTIRYWDLRSPTPAHTLQLPERCYTIDVRGPLMVVGCAERHILIFNLNNPSTPFKTFQSTLKWQTRVISCFPDASGYALGSIEGRVAIEYVEDKDQNKKFSFKCHRVDNKNVFPVNAISFHHQYGTFSTAGGDGSVHFWDKDSKRSLKALTIPTSPSPITATSFNRNGTIFAYGVGYDWHKGHEHSQQVFSFNQTNKNTIMLHPVNDEDIKPKPKK